MGGEDDDGFEESGIGCWQDAGIRRYADQWHAFDLRLSVYGRVHRRRIQPKRLDRDVEGQTLTEGGLFLALYRCVKGMTSSRCQILDRMTNGLAN
jgi:hypothetical protein